MNLDFLKSFNSRIFIFNSFWKTEKMLFLEALFFLFKAKGMILLFPFKYCLLLTKNNKNNYLYPSLEQLKSIQKAIYKANKLSFWKNVCLVQSVTARWMLRRRRISSEFYIGIRVNEYGKIVSHAWLESHGFSIIDKGDDFKILLKN